MIKFTDYILILEALAAAPGGLTAGQIRRNHAVHMETQKISRILKSLESDEDGMVWSARVAYRPNVFKIVWRIREIAAMFCSTVAMEYSANEGIHPPEPQFVPLKAVVDKLRAGKAVPAKIYTAAGAGYNMRHELEKASSAAPAESYEALHERYQDAQESAYYARADAQAAAEEDGNDDIPF
jgi:hypothetical protein